MRKSHMMRARDLLNFSVFDVLEVMIEKFQEAYQDRIAVNLSDDMTMFSLVSDVYTCAHVRERYGIKVWLRKAMFSFQMNETKESDQTCPTNPGPESSSKADWEDPTAAKTSDAAGHSC